MTPHLSPLLLFSSVAALAAIATFYAWTSRINQFFFFARTLPQSFADTPAARTITRRYIVMVLIAAGVSVIAFTLLYAVAAQSCYLALVTGVLLEMILLHLAFAWAHHATGHAFAAFQQHLVAVGAGHDPVQTHPSSDRTIAVSLLPAQPQANSKLILAPLLITVGIWLGGIATSSYGFSSFTEASGAQGGSVLLGMACGMLFGGTAMRLMLRYSARQRTPMAHYIVRVMAVLSWFSVVMVGLIVVATRLHHPITKAVAHGIMISILVGVAIHLVYAWSRSKQFVPSSAEFNGDQHWRAGLFYYNPQDPALFVQRRNGPGYTLNFGYIFSWPVAAFVIADFAFLLIFRRHI
jgi:uncharacterized membrane protein